MALAFTIEYFWIVTVIFHVSSIILALIFITHTYNLISDLCTTQRKAVAHKEKVPTIDRNYKIVALLTHISIFGFFMTTLLPSLSEWSIIGNKTTCPYFAIFGAITYIISKVSMYLVFVYRLYIVYGKSCFKYPPFGLSIVAVINIIYAIFQTIVVILNTQVNPKTHLFANYATFCDPTYPFWYILTSAAYDLIMCLLCLFAFQYPIKKISEIRKSSNCQSKAHRSIMKMAMKSKILTYTAAISTLIVLIFIIFSQSLLLWPVDAIINCVCICLMTPYYQSYPKLCKICIVCCNHQKSESNLSVKATKMQNIGANSFAAVEV